MQTLYRKYRAANFDQIIGQDHVVKIIKQSILENRISHAYLFTGPRGTGKTSLARLLAKVINCTNVSKAGEPCDSCSHCKSINKGSFMDLIEIDAASNRGIEEIRDLKEKINFLPVEGKNKVYIIDEVHMLTSEAFNALLKTLEEPPSNVVFILATTEPHKLPLTIISRTQRFDFKIADSDSLNQKLKYIIESEGYSLSDQALNLIINAGQGSFRDAETVLEKVLFSFKDKKIIEREDIEKILGFVPIDLIREFIDKLINNDLNGSLEILHDVWRNGLSLIQFNKELLDEVREQLLFGINNIDSTKKVDNKKLILIIKEFNTAFVDMKNSLLNVLPLELAIFNVVGFESMTKSESRPSKVRNFETIPDKEDGNKNIQKFVDEANPLKKDVIKTELKIPSKNNITNISIQKKFNLILDKWQEILLKAKDHNHFLTAILTGAQLDLVNDEIVLKVTSSFHKKRLDNNETKKILLKIINDLTGESIDFQCIIHKEDLKKESSTNNEKIVEEIFN
jgi:DNA polymerase-3 subunit gamma/tau